MDSIWRQINNAIQCGDVESAKKLIPKYLKANRSSPEALYEASEFYRKTMDYKAALRVLPKERRLGSTSNLSEAEVRLELQLARLLNFLGASNYALRMVDQLRSAGLAKSKVEIGEIYFCNYRFSELVDLIGPDFQLPKSEPWHQDWLLHFYLAYALCELNQVDAAIARVDGIQRVSTSPMIQALALSYKGKFLLRAGEPEKALNVLLESLKFFQNHDQTADHTNLQLFLGECFFNLQRYREAEVALKKAINGFYQPGMRTEDWMEPLLLLERIPGQRNEGDRLAPRLAAMLGSDHFLLKLWDYDPINAENLIFSVSRIEDSQGKIHLDRVSDTVWNGKKARLGLDLVEKLVCHLIYAGEHGLPQFRVYEFLWPDEPFSFDQHEKRLESVVSRARKQGYKILWKDLQLRLLSSGTTASGRPQRVVRGLCFLKEHPLFARHDVERYFSLSKTRAKVLCQHWALDGLIVLETNSKYRVILA